MAEVTYLEHLIKNHTLSKQIKNLAQQFLSLKTTEELEIFAKKNRINIKNNSLNFEKLREKIAFDLIEKCFQDRNKNMDKIK